MGRTACTEPQCLYNGALNLYITFCGDESVSGLVSVDFVYKLSLKMAEPFLNCRDVEQRALMRFFVVRRHKISEFLSEKVSDSQKKA